MTTPVHGELYIIRMKSNVLRPVCNLNGCEDYDDLIEILGGEPTFVVYLKPDPSPQRAEQDDPLSIVLHVATMKTIVVFDHRLEPVQNASPL